MSDAHSVSQSTSLKHFLLFMLFTLLLGPARVLAGQLIFYFDDVLRQAEEKDTQVSILELMQDAHSLDLFNNHQKILVTSEWHRTENNSIYLVADTFACKIGTALKQCSSKVIGRVIFRWRLMIN